AAQVSTAAASRLAERSRFGALARQEADMRRASGPAGAGAAEASERLRTVQGEERNLRQLWREAQGKLAQTRDVLTAMERQARKTGSRIAAVAEARSNAQEALAEAHMQLAETEESLKPLAGTEGLEAE